MKKELSIEQMCRDLLEIALKSGLASKAKNFDDPDPQARTSGELAAMANKLAEYFEG